MATNNGGSLKSFPERANVKPLRANTANAPMPLPASQVPAQGKGANGGSGRCCQHGVDESGFCPNRDRFLTELLARRAR